MSLILVISSWSSMTSLKWANSCNGSWASCARCSFVIVQSENIHFLLKSTLWHNLGNNLLHIYFQYDFNLLYPYIKCYLYNFNLIGEKSTILHVAILLCIDYNVYWSIYQLKVRLVIKKSRKTTLILSIFFLGGGRIRGWRSDFQGWSSEQPAINQTGAVWGNS